MYRSLFNIIKPISIQKLIGDILPPNQNIVGVYKEIAFPIFHQINSKLLTTLKSIYDS
jgi:hypothetical protein